MYTCTLFSSPATSLLIPRLIKDFLRSAASSHLQRGNTLWSRGSGRTVTFPVCEGCGHALRLNPPPPTPPTIAAPSLPERWSNTAGLQMHWYCVSWRPHVADFDVRPKKYPLSQNSWVYWKWELLGLWYVFVFWASTVCEGSTVAHDHMRRLKYPNSLSK